MCSAGYIASRTKLARDVTEFFAVVEELAGISRHAIRPTHDTPFIRQESDGHLHVRMLHWGLVPFWAKDQKFSHSTFNARSESLAEKPTFREPFRSRRGILPWVSYVEWREELGINVPYELSLRNEAPLALAGLWDCWTDGKTILESCTIVTTTPNELASQFQDRMPVILHPEHYDLWLSPATPASDLKVIMAPYPASEMKVELANPEDFKRKAPNGPQGVLEF